MKRSQLFILPILVFFLASDLYSQKVEWYVQGSAGQSFINIQDSDVESQWGFHWNYTGGIRYHLTDKLAIETGIGLTAVKGQHDIPHAERNEAINLSEIDISGILQGLPYERPNSSGGEIIALSNAYETSQNNRYLSMPLTLLVKRKKLGFRSGVQAMYLVNHNVDQTTLLEQQSKFSFGLLAGFQFSVLANLNIDLNYYHGLTNDQQYFSSPRITETSKEFDAQNHMINLGISYSFKAE